MQRRLPPREGHGLALRRGVITRSPVDGLAPSERPKQRNAKKIAVLTGADMEKLIGTASTERWKAAIGLAGYAGLRLGEVRGLRWGDVDLEGNTISICAPYSPAAPRKHRRPRQVSVPCHCSRRCGGI